ncbi:hypothetical protein R3P38DRAFT_2763610 [Favolaschia claudopus]|uniref:Uncharacterized protein n=1 Tax=Favolaschia claudopus TaxID=2862362 RepID=A0AAW0DCG2_9AGAR
MQEEGPYKEHLRNYVNEKDVSSCIAFKALLQKDNRLTTGLRSSGVGGVVCARHELIRPQGLGNLQKGERYSNMDYIVLASLLGITLLWLAISYDVACQWQVNFPRRMEEMPENLRLDLTIIQVLFALPVWHAMAHERSCQVQNSLTYTAGVGRTDGEGIERVWSRLIAIAWATRVMGRGAREDGIEDKVDHENYEKNINQGQVLPRKLIVAIAERDEQIAGFEQVDATLEGEVREEWQGIIDAWKSDRQSKNPYESATPTRAASEAAIRRELAKEELEDASAGRGGQHGTSMTSFVVMGLQLEDAQFRIKRQVAQRGLLASDQSERLAELRRSFFIKLRKFRRLQEVYAPGAVQQLAEDEEKRDPELPALQAEATTVYLPSRLPRVKRDGCSEELKAKEMRLRVGQMEDCVAKLRRCLLSRRHLWDWREQNVGQRAGTRAATLAQRIQKSIDETAARYRSARAALLALGGEEAGVDWPELKDDDIRVEEERDSDAGARRKLANVGLGAKETRKSRRAGRAHSSKHVMSWIWTSGGGPGEDEEDLREAVRVEWSKAQARRDRWTEEVQHLREEMRRVLRFLRWTALKWEKRASVEREVDQNLRGGLKAYAARQAATARSISRRFRNAWDTSVSDTVRAALREEAAMGVEDDGMDLLIEEF